MNLRKFYKNKNCGKKNQDVNDPFHLLADEVALYIFSFLDVKDLLMLCAVSQRMRQLAADNKLWKPFINKQGSKSSQPYTTFFSRQQKTLRLNELFNQVREEELRFKYLSHHIFEHHYFTFTTPLLLSYAFFLEVNPLAYTEIKTNTAYKYQQDDVANHLLTKLPVINHADILILKELYKFLSQVYPSSQRPSSYIHVPGKGCKDLPLLYLYITFKKCAEQNLREIIFFKDPSFFKELNDFFTHNKLKGNKLMVFSEMLMDHPEILYTKQIIIILRDMLNHLKNTDRIISRDLFDYYQNSLHSCHSVAMRGT